MARKAKYVGNIPVGSIATDIRVTLVDGVDTGDITLTGIIVGDNIISGIVLSGATSSDVTSHISIKEKDTLECDNDLSGSKILVTWEKI